MKKEKESSSDSLGIRADRFELGVNAVVHVLLIFTALTILYVFIISGASEKGLQTAVDNAISTNLSSSLIYGNTQTNGQLKVAMQRLNAPLAVMELMQQNNQNKEHVNDVYNNGLFNTAYFIIGLITVTLVTMLLVMAYGANIRINPMVKRIAIANAVVFAVVGGFEFFFFETTAIKFIPVQPSTITNDVVNAMKTYA